MLARLAVLAALVLASLAFSPAAAAPGQPAAEKFAGGFKHPVDIEWGPDGHLYVSELASGEVLRVDRSGNRVGGPLLKVDVSFGGERGLVGMTLDPEHAGRIWVYYTMAGGSPDDTPSWRGTNRLSYFEAGKETVVAEFKAGFMHNGGRLAFDPNGDSIYVAVGDNADRANAQNLDVPEGKVLRIDREGNGVDGNHRDRIFTYGHRNMYGIAVAPSGTVFLTENMNGQNDEVNLLTAGKDYGWPHCEGTYKTDQKVPCDHGGSTPPLFQYTPTISPTGAAWFHGDWWFAAFNKGDIHRVHQDGGTWKDDIAYHHGETPRILDVTPGPEGNTLYFSVWTVRDNPEDSEGQIWKLTFPGYAADNSGPGGKPDAGWGKNVAPEDPNEPPGLTNLPTPALLAAAALAVGAAVVARRRR